MSKAYKAIMLCLVVSVLAGAKRDELEKNNLKISKIIKKAASVANQLGETSQKVLGTVKSGSASTEELSTISEEQVSLIATTFTYNENISKQIEVENEQFASIVEVVQSNTKEFAELNSQADGLDNIVRELEELLIKY